MSIGSAQCKIKSHRRGAKNAEEKIFFLAAERTARKKPLHLGGDSESKNESDESLLQRPL
jgi:hypothetical protein